MSISTKEFSDLRVFPKGLFYIAFCSALVLSACELSPSIRTFRTPSYPDRGEFTVYSPHDRTDKIPLLIVLHGYRAEAWQERLYLSLESFAEEKNFHVAYLSGTKDRSGDRYWNASPSCCDLDHLGINDSDYIDQTIIELRRKLPISKIYLVGHSNGGFMAHRLICDLGDKIAGIVSLAARDEPRKCAPRKYSKVKIIEVLPAADHTLFEEGGSFKKQPRYGSFEETLGLWKTKLACPAGANPDVVRKNYSLAIWGDESELRRFECGDGNRLVSIRINGGSHIPFINDTFRSDILDFLLE